MLVATLLVLLLHSVKGIPHVKKAVEAIQGLTHDQLEAIEAIASEEFAQGVTYDEMVAFAQRDGYDPILLHAEPDYTEGEDYDPIIINQEFAEGNDYDNVLIDQTFIEGNDYDPVKFSEGNDYDNVNYVSATQNLDFDVAAYNAWLDGWTEETPTPSPQLESLKARIRTLENSEISVVKSLGETTKSEDRVVAKIISRIDSLELESLNNALDRQDLNTKVTALSLTARYYATKEETVALEGRLLETIAELKLKQMKLDEMLSEWIKKFSSHSHTDDGMRVKAKIISAEMSSVFIESSAQDKHKYCENRCSDGDSQTFGITQKEFNPWYKAITDVPFRSITVTIEARYVTDPTTQFTIYTLNARDEETICASYMPGENITEINHTVQCDHAGVGFKISALNRGWGTYLQIFEIAADVLI